MKNSMQVTSLAANLWLNFQKRWQKVLSRIIFVYHHKLTELQDTNAFTILLPHTQTHVALSGNLQ